MRTFLVGTGFVVILEGIVVLLFGLGMATQLLSQPSLDTGDSTWTVISSIISALGLAMIVLGLGLIRTARS